MFNDFYSHLSDIVNSSFNLGEPIDNTRVVKKILRSLPKRFIPKVTVLNSLGKLNSLKLEELVGDLQTYEIDMFPQTIKAKDRGVALKTQVRKKKKERVYESDSEGEFSIDDVALFANFFKKFLKMNKNNFSNKNSFEKNKKKEKAKEGSEKEREGDKEEVSEED